MSGRRVEWVGGAMTVCQIRDVSQADLMAPFTFLSRTDAELSLVCPTGRAPEDTLAREDGWRMLRVAGTMPFSLTGVMASLSGALAGAGVPLFALSTYDTDYIMVKEEHVGAAEAALERAGWRFAGPD